MRTIPALCLAATLACTGFFSVASAQVTPPMGRRQPPAGMPRFDPATVTTLTGRLATLDTIPSMSGFAGRGLHASIVTAAESLPVMVGPVTYLAQQKARLARGDAVTITGSRVSTGGMTVMLPSTIVTGADTLRLRDANGLPLWRGMRRTTMP